MSCTSSRKDQAAQATDNALCKSAKNDCRISSTEQNEIDKHCVENRTPQNGQLFTSKSSDENVYRQGKSNQKQPIGQPDKISILSRNNQSTLSSGEAKVKSQSDNAQRNRTITAIATPYNAIDSRNKRTVDLTIDNEHSYSRNHTYGRSDQSANNGFVEGYEEKENVPSPLNYRTDFTYQNRSDRSSNGHKTQHEPFKEIDEAARSAPDHVDARFEWQHNAPAPITYEYSKHAATTSYVQSNPDQGHGGDWYDKYYGSYSYEGYHQPYMYYNNGPEPPRSSYCHGPPHTQTNVTNATQNDVPHSTGNKTAINTDVHSIHQVSSSKLNSTSHPRQGNSYGNNFTIVDHTYRDFSGVPPTEEDRERYSNKKKEYTKRLNNTSYDDREEDHSYGGNDAVKKRRGRGNRETRNGSNRFIGFMGTNFPARLHDLLSHDEDISNIITWLPHGRSWIVLDKKEFLKKVAPSHFQISKFESFTRQVNGWGFKRITQGPDINSYYHELFLRGMPHLIQWMKRSTSSGPGRRKIRSDPREEPDFYAISQMYPIPDYYGESHGANPPTIDHASPAILRESSTHPPQLNSSDCREVLDILVNNESPVNKRTKTVKKKLSSRMRDVEPIMYCSKTTIPSPIQPKAKRAKRGDRKSKITTDEISPPRIEAISSHQMDNDEPLSSKDIEEVKTFWSGNHAASDGFYYQSSPCRHSPQRNAYPQHTYSEDNYHTRSNHYQQSDFHPSEGTIGDREIFCWDDVEFRERDHHYNAYSDQNNRYHNRRPTHHNSESFSNIPQDAPPEATAWALI